MPFLLNISIPGENGFLEPVRELAVKVAEYAGYASSEAGQIAMAVTSGAAAVIKGAPRPLGSIGIRFHTDEERFEVTLTYPGDRAPALTSAKGVDEIVCRREGPLQICRMIRQLPGGVEPVVGRR